MLDLPEASNYASQLNDAILAAGWETVVKTGDSSSPPVTGLVCEDCDPFFESALRSAGIPFTRKSGAGAAKVARLVIGTKEP